jgi:hypothetical protein
MGSLTVNPVTPLYTGAAVTRTDSGGTTSTIIIDHTTAQSALDLSKLVVVFENYSSTASFVATLNAGDDFSEVDQGAAAALTIATAGTAGFIRAFGGVSFESARFLDKDEQVEFTITTAATCYISAYLLP